MWIQDWGTMIWGGEAQVPLLFPMGWILLGALIGATGALYGRPRSKTYSVVALLAIAVVPLSALAVPYVFMNGTPADAVEVNASFADIENALPNLDYSPRVFGAVVTVPVKLQIQPDTLSLLRQGVSRQQNSGVRRLLAEAISSPILFDDVQMVSKRRRADAQTGLVESIVAPA